MSSWLKGRISPEMLYLETKWSSLIPFAKTADLWKEVLPVDVGRRTRDPDVAKLEARLEGVPVPYHRQTVRPLKVGQPFPTVAAVAGADGEPRGRDARLA